MTTSQEAIADAKVFAQCRKPIPDCLIVIFVILFLSAAPSFSSDELTSPLSQPAPQTAVNDFQKTKKSLERFNNRPETDTTPVYIGKGKVRYKIPRNYIVRMFDWTGKSEDNSVTMRVTFPGFEPLTEKTRDCLTKAPLYRPSGCVPIEFWTGVGHDDGEIHRSLSPQEQFNNASDLFHNSTPKPGPAGFERYETGPDNARIETYRKQTKNGVLVYSCGLIQIKNGKRWAMCDNFASVLPNGGYFHYLIQLDQIKDAEQIDEGLRKLIMSFTLPGDKP